MSSLDSVFVPLTGPAAAAVAAPAARTVLVTGGTGNQGGATARHLLAGGWTVRALVRDPNTPAARALAEAGARLVPGDLADRASLDRAADGVYGVFSVQAVSMDGAADAAGGAAAEAEIAMGVDLAAAAHAAGAQLLVFASVAGADRDPKPWHWKTKARIEEHIRTLGIPYAFLRPVMFMENHASRGPFGAAGRAALVRFVRPATRVQMIAATDIGAFAALAFADPGAYAGRELELAGDELTGAQLAAAISRAVGRPVNTDPIARDLAEVAGVDVDELESAKDFGGWQADLPALRKLHPGLLDFEGWLAAGGAARLAALFS